VGANVVGVLVGIIVIGMDVGNAVGFNEGRNVGRKVGVSDEGMMVSGGGAYAIQHSVKVAQKSDSNFAQPGSPTSW